MKRLTAQIASCLFASAIAARGADWKIPREFRRSVEGGEKAATAAFSFCAGGKVSAGYRAVVVADEQDNVIPSEVLYCEPSGLTWVAYQAESVKGRAWVYYGGLAPTPSPPSGKWKPELSLTLKTLPLPDGALDGYRPIAAAARGRLYGMGFVDNIFHALNPHGPNDNFASVYEGYLRIEKPGRYRIFTNSDDASFVLLDGKETASWPGEHEARSRRGEHGTDMQLAKGLYKIEYYHAETKGPQLMSLGWVPPGEKGWHIVPASAFLHTPVAKCGPPERRAGAPLAACEWEQYDQMLHEGNQYTRIKFTDQCRAAPPGARIEMDYGDKQKSDACADHVYIGDGPFECEMKLIDKGGKILDQYSTSIRITIPATNLTIGNSLQVREYLETLAKYDLPSLPPLGLKAAWELVETQDDASFILPFGEEYLRRFGERGSPWEIMERLAMAYSIRDPEKAAALYGKLADRAPSEKDALRVKTERLEIVIFKLKDFRQAQQLATSNTRPMEVRMGNVKLGDIYRAQDDLEKAEQAYRKAQEKAFRQMDRREIAVRQSWYFETVLSLIEQKHLREARDKLIEWEIDFPTGKLSGDLILATARYFQTLGDHSRALEELTTLTRINPLSPYLPEIEFRMGLAHAALGDPAKGRRLMEKVAREYPNSRAARLAEAALRRLQ